MKNKFNIILVKSLNYLKFCTEWLKNNRIQAFILSIILILFFTMALKENKEYFVSPQKHLYEQTQKESLAGKLIKSETVIIFFQPGCHSCFKQKLYLQKVLQKKYPKIKFEYHDATKPQEIDLMKIYYKSYGLDIKNLTTPSVFAGKDYLLGYESDEESGKKLEIIIQNNYFPQKKDKDIKQAQNKNKIRTQKYINTWFGKINVFEQSLPALAIILGLVDGFNPCAMWVLVYLISLIVQLNDRSKIWLIVGSFVLASGILYYLFMTAMLNIFLYIGYLRILQLLIGCIALYIGINNLKIYFTDKGQIVCKVENAESKKKTMNRIQNIVNSEISVMTILGIIALAFVVNSVEFVCSAALPALYTSILAQAKLSAFNYYLYILLYVLSFMLDDLIIFGLAVFAVNRYIGDRYVVHCKLIGGIILVLLGILIVFFPQYLR